MSKKLFVGNISWGVSDDQLREAFEAFGDVEDSIILKDRETGRSRGFGFVTFTDEAAADSAIEAMHDKELDGRPLVVNENMPASKALAFCSEKKITSLLVVSDKDLRKKNKKLKGIIHIHFLLKNGIK